jgi:beta-barrel assembly-enhancing protease
VKRFMIPTLMLCAAILSSSCAILELGTQIGVATGKISPDQAKSINRVGTAGEKAFQGFTPENEYWIGRSVAATILKAYKPYDNPAANKYLNELGQTIAAFSDKPETFGGYHFLIMDTDEVNAFAAPGGLILVSRGLIRCCRTEDALATVLAHEVGHIELGHAMSRISSGRLTELGTVFGAEVAKNAGGAELAKGVEILEGSISDIVNDLVKNGFARSDEYNADKAAATIVARVGYSPLALKEMIVEAGKKAPEGSAGFGKTHPTTDQRLNKLGPSLAGAAPVSTPQERQARFQKALKGV